MNRININGDFTIWQMGTSFPIMPHADIFADMWRYHNTTASSFSIARSVDAPPMAVAGRRVTQSVQMICLTGSPTLTAAANCGIVFRGEGYDWARMHEKPTVLQFCVKSSKPGVYYAGIECGTEPYVSCPMAYSVDRANTWEKKVLLLPRAISAGGWTFENGVGYSLYFFLALGSQWFGTPNVWNEAPVGGASDQVNACDTAGNVFAVSGVDLKVGAQETDFEAWSYDEEFRRCQRYIESSFRPGVVPEAGQGLGSGAHVFPAWRTTSKDLGSPSVYFRVPKRKVPALTSFNPSSLNDQVRNITRNTDCSNTMFASATETSFTVAAVASSGTHEGDKMAVHWLADASVPAAGGGGT